MINQYLFKNRSISWLILLSILIAGITSLHVLPRLEDPILSPRVGVITVTNVGADALEIESSVVKPIESWLQKIPEIRRLRSNIRTNVANIVIELEDQVSKPEETWSLIETELDSKFNFLPESCSRPELKIFPLKAYAAIVALVPSSENSVTLRRVSLLADELKSEILNLGGTTDVDLFGDVEEEFLIRVLPSTLSRTGISTGYLAEQILSHRKVPAGNLETDDTRLAVQIGSAGDLQERVKQLPIELPGQQDTIRLGDLAKVAFELKSSPQDFALIDKNRAIVLGILIENDVRIDRWTARLGESLQKFESRFPDEYSIQSLFLQNDQVSQRLNGLVQNLLISTLSVMLIVFLFMGWRCMLVIGLMLPLSAALVLLGFRAFSVPIHQMSVTGLIVSLGLLIDNAIVMTESVRSKIYAGDTPNKAMRDSVRHLGMPLTGSTLTTVFAFLPIAIMPGPSGEFVGSIAVTVILAITASLALALTILPSMIFLFGLNFKRRGFLNFGIQSGLFGKIYFVSLKTIFRFPILGILIGIVLPSLGLYFSARIDKQFFPANDRAQIQIEIELQNFNNLDALKECVKQAESIVENTPKVLHQYWFLGRSAPTFYYNVVPRRISTPNYAQAFIDLRDTSDLDFAIQQLQRRLDQKLCNARVIVRKLEQGPPFDAPIELRIFGNDLDQLQELGQQMRLVLSQHPKVIHTRSDLGDRMPRLDWQLDFSLLKRTGITEREASKFLFTNLAGASAGNVYVHGREIPARVVIDNPRGVGIQTLMQLPIHSSRPSGIGRERTALDLSSPVNLPASLPFGSLGTVQTSFDQGAIIRDNGRRVNEVKAYLQTGTLPSVALSQIQSALNQSGFSLPAGYQLEFGGEDEKRSEAISTLVANISVIVAGMILVLVAGLGSIRSAVIVASVAGLVIGLCPLILFSLGYPLGFMAIVGTMGLIGIAINDSIVVLAAIQEGGPIQLRGNRETGPNVKDTNDIGLRLTDRGELADAMAKIVSENTRHILATTLTTMIGFLPLVIDGGKFWPPLAIVISLGVAGATILALYFTPSAYLILHRFDASVSDLVNLESLPGEANAD
ncbi:MAG: efflux RND transporter permease subunit [Planctomycetota bacterium]